MADDPRRSRPLSQSDRGPRVGLLWRSEWDSNGDTKRCKLRQMFEAFATLGVAAEPVVYSDDVVESVRDQLLRLDGVLVWVNPLEQGLDRSRLDPLLGDVARGGVFVSAHPDVILKMGTKEVLAKTQEMSWGTETRIYRTAAELREHLAGRLSHERPIVLKRHRGMGGNGVWKVQWEDKGSTVLAQHAAGASAPESLELNDFLDRCTPYFDDGGFMVEQPFQLRLPDGMIRAYLTHNKVVGFTHQYPRGLMPPGPDDRPTSKVFEPPAVPAYRALRSQLESEWVAQMQEILGVGTASLPVIWDADFLYGPRTSSGEDTYLLCEINVSSTFAFPEFAMPRVAEATLERIRERGMT
ncbi:MAG: Cj0069 family protein [Gaiellaceae bacterium]